MADWKPFSYFLPESDFWPGIVDYFHNIETLEAAESALAVLIHRYNDNDILQLEGAIV